MGSEKCPRCEVCGGLHGVHRRAIPRPRKSIEYLTKQAEAKGLLRPVDCDDKSIDKIRTDDNKVPWDEKDSNFYSNKKAIEEATKVDNEYDVDELKNLDYDKLKKLLRKPTCTIRFMSVKSPRPRGKVHKIDWQKYLKNQIERSQKVENIAEQKVLERMQ
ncbi:MAG: hypothetical protein CEE38_14455 [Planctomycetes bacterium B3_Pla]|nr:MAG: hypothetical protein CEE38_14455 [Planctomycetes bacterium B3_Pla]